LPYRGLGTGIRRALAEWPAVDLLDDRDACTFTAIIRLQTRQNAPANAGCASILQRDAPINAPITNLQRNILSLVAADQGISYDAMAAAFGCDRTTVMRNIRELKTMVLLRREGSRKTGSWVVGS
jgi:ATP-dependent DNA helicase RecG